MCKFFIANAKAYPFGCISTETEGISSGLSLENTFGHFDDFNLSKFYNITKIDNIDSDVKFVLHSTNAPQNYRIKLESSTVKKINNIANVWLVLVNFLEGHIDREKLSKSIVKNGIKRKKVIVLTGNYSYHNTIVEGVKYVYADYWESFTRYHQRFLASATDRKHINLEATKKFLCLNRNIKAHRVWFYFNMLRYGVEKHGHVSYHLPTVNKAEYQKIIVSSLVIKYLPRGLHEEYKAFLRTAEAGQSLDTLGENAINYNTSITKYYNDSLFSIVTESDFRSTFLTEKTFKAIVHYHPFFIIGNPQHHELLRKNGYHTFEEFFETDSVINFDQSSKFLSTIKYSSLQDYKNKFDEKILDKLHSNYENFYNRSISFNTIEENLIHATR